MANTMMTKTVYVLLSGGLDSMACVHFFKSINCYVKCININYGQKSREQETEAAKVVADYFSCPLQYVICSNLPVIDGEIMGRNALLIIVALYIIQKENAYIATGIHAGTNFSDCRPIFSEKMQGILDLYSDGKVQIVNPFIQWSKKDIWDYCNYNKLPINLTYSCEMGTIPPCGQCLTCRDLEALKNDFGKNANN